MVSKRYLDELDRHRKDLRVFRTLMVRLERDHPDIYKLVKQMHRDIDTQHKGLYDGPTVS